MRKPHQSGVRTRDELLRIIREAKGIHKSELRRQAGRGWGNVGHHLVVLEREGRVDLETHGRLVWIFDREIPRAERDLMVATRPSAARKILEILGMRQKATIRALSDELSVSKKVIRVHLSTLQRAQAVEKLAGRPPEFAPVRRQR